MFQNRIILILLFITLLSSLVIQQAMIMHVALASPSSCQVLPIDGRAQPQKGANADPDTWKVVPMRDDPSLFKVVDSAGINVADLFHSRTNAEQYVAHYVCVSSPPPSPTPTPPTPTPPTPPAPRPTEIYCTDREFACLGTNRDDIIHGSDFDEEILGMEGDDRIDGRGGKDVIDGGFGDDTIYGNDGNDVIDADAGNDNVYGGYGRNTIRGGVGDDRIEGGDSSDIIYGNAGYDKLYGHGGDDRIYHGYSSQPDGSEDDIYCGEGNDRVWEGDGFYDFTSDCEITYRAPPSPPSSGGNEDCDRAGMPGCP